jgi:hypothetical protein
MFVLFEKALSMGSTTYFSGREDKYSFAFLSLGTQSDRAVHKISIDEFCVSMK